MNRFTPIEIEIGRQNNQPEVQCICKLCKVAVEDEIHFLIRCSKLGPAHDPYIEKILSNVPLLGNCNKKGVLKWILSNEDPDIIK